MHSDAAARALATTLILCSFTFQTWAFAEEREVGSVAMARIDHCIYKGVENRAPWTPICTFRVLKTLVGRRLPEDINVVLEHPPSVTSVTRPRPYVVASGILIVALTPKTHSDVPDETLYRLDEASSLEHIACLRQHQTLAMSDEERRCIDMLELTSGAFRSALHWNSGELLAIGPIIQWACRENDTKSPQVDASVDISTTCVEFILAKAFRRDSDVVEDASGLRAYGDMDVIGSGGAPFSIVALLGNANEHSYRQVLEYGVLKPHWCATKNGPLRHSLEGVFNELTFASNAVKYCTEVDNGIEGAFRSSN